MSLIALRNLLWQLALVLWLTVPSRFAFAAPDDVEPPKAAEANEQPQVFVDVANIDQWIFQGRGNADSARQRLQSALQLQIDELHRVCELTDAQKRKLSLAARGDIRQFFEQVEAIREKFGALQNDANAFNGIWQEIQPLQQKLSRGLFGETSFFAKTLRKTLTPEQTVKYKANVEERRKYRYRAMVEVGVTTLENSVPLRHEQHTALVKLLLEKTQPPQTFGQHDNYVILHQLSTLPENEVKALLDERQWALLQRQVGQFRGMLPVLRQNGILIQ
ncbi:MAG: hypothetical protein WD894_08340 [Pirellulales bacterium]